MNFSLNTIMLFVKDVELLKHFYQENFHFELSEEIKDEWVVLKAGNCNLALHKSHAVFEENEFTPETNNVKLIVEATPDLHKLREELIRKNIPMKEIKSFPGFPSISCDGKDPEGNVFQLTQRMSG